MQNKGSIQESEQRSKSTEKQSIIGGETMFSRLVMTIIGLRVVQEYKFHPIRKWRFDYAIVEYKIAIEVEGGIWRKGGGAHSRPANIIRDIEKYNQAAVSGWVVIRVTPQELISNKTIRLIKSALENGSK